MKSSVEPHLTPSLPPRPDSVSVHIVVKRYAALASSMLVLMAEYDSDESGLFKAQVGGIHGCRSWRWLTCVVSRTYKCDSNEAGLSKAPVGVQTAWLAWLSLEVNTVIAPCLRLQTFYDMMDRLWAAMFDLVLRMSNLFKERLQVRGMGRLGERLACDTQGALQRLYGGWARATLVATPSAKLWSSCPHKTNRALCRHPHN